MCMDILRKGTHGENGSRDRRGRWEGEGTRGGWLGGERRTVSPRPSPHLLVLRVQQHQPLQPFKSSVTVFKKTIMYLHLSLV